MRLSRHLTLTLLLVLIGTACAPNAAPPGGSSNVPAAPAAPKRLIAAITGDPFTVLSALNQNGGTRGIATVQALVHRGLTVVDDQSVKVAMLAEAAPTIENGLWKILPTGAMETTQTIRQGAKWHDGTPFTTADLVFSAKIAQDKDLGFVRNVALDYVDSVQAVDARTITVKWKQTFINADDMFGVAAVPVASHLLEKAYADDKSTFLTLPYWSTDFVGTGPYKIQSWTLGSSMTLVANDAFVLGRPKIDEIEVRFIPDANVLVAATLAGAIDYTGNERGISLEQALTVQNQWKGGVVGLNNGGNSGMFMWPQMLDPNPAIVANVKFRKAMITALDRQLMVDTIQYGLSEVKHSGLDTTDALYPTVDAQIVKYPYDPRLATQMVTDLGYTKGTDGFFRDGQGAKLSIELRTVTGDINNKSILASADNWNKIGVATDPVTIPVQRQADREYRSTYPTFQILRGGLNFNVRTQDRPLPSNNYTGPSYSRYSNPELDTLVDKYFTTIPLPERMLAAGAVARHMSENVVVIPLFSDPLPEFASNRFKNVKEISVLGPTYVYQWELI